MQTSTLYTIGTALRRAGDTGKRVQVLVEGEWLIGSVAAVDSHGLILDTELEHAVVRLEAISAVRVAGTLEQADSSAVPLPGAQHEREAAALAADLVSAGH